MRSTNLLTYLVTYETRERIKVVSIWSNNRAQLPERKSWLRPWVTISGQSWIEEVGERIPSLSPLFPSPPLPSPSTFPPLLEVGHRSYRSGERCKLPQRIWCILALKSDIQWPQF